MKNIIIAIIITLICAAVAMAGTIKPSGMSQKDLYNLLAKMVTMQNELKADHNALVSTNRAAFGTYSTTVNLLTTSTSDLSLTQ